MADSVSEEPRVVKLEIEVTSETARDLGMLILEKGWEYEDGLRMILGAGLGCLRMESAIQGKALGQSEDETLKPIRQRLIGTEARLAAIRYQLYVAQQKNEAWELSTGAIEKKSYNVEIVAQRQRQEIAALKERVRQQQEEIDRLRTQLESARSGLEQPSQGETPPPRRHFWKRWLFRTRRS